MSKPEKKYLIKVIEDIDKNSQKWYYHSKLLIPTQKLEAAAIYFSVDEALEVIQTGYMDFKGEMKEPVCFVQILEYKSGTYNVLKSFANQGKFPF